MIEISRISRISRREFLKAAGGFTLFTVLPTLRSCEPDQRINCPVNPKDGLNEFMGDLVNATKIEIAELKNRIANQFPSTHPALLIGESHGDDDQTKLARAIISELTNAQKIGQMFYEDYTFWKYENLSQQINALQFNPWSMNGIENIAPSPANGVVLYAGSMHVHPELHNRWAFNETDSYYEKTQKPEFQTLWEVSKGKGINPLTLLMIDSDGVYRDAEMDILRKIQTNGLPQQPQIIENRNKFVCGVVMVEPGKVYDFGNDFYVYLSPNQSSEFGEARLLEAASDISRILYSPTSPLQSVDLNQLRFHSGVYTRGGGYGMHHDTDYVLIVSDANHLYEFIFPSDDKNKIILDIYDPSQKDYIQKDIVVPRP